MIHTIAPNNDVTPSPRKFQRMAKLQAAKACEDSGIRQIAKLGDMG